MNKEQIDELYDLMDDYGYFEPDIYPAKGKLFMFIDQTQVSGNPVMFDPETGEFTVAVFDDEDVGEYEYENDEWDENVSERQIKAYEATRLARDIARNKGRNPKPKW